MNELRLTPVIDGETRNMRTPTMIEQHLEDAAREAANKEFAEFLDWKSDKKKKKDSKKGLSQRETFLLWAGFTPAIILLTLWVAGK